MKKTIATARILAVLFGVSACATMDMTTEAPETQGSDDPAI